MILAWAGVGLACGVLGGGLTRSLLRRQHLRYQVWTAATLITSGSFAVLAWRLGSDFSVWPYSYLAAVLVVLSVVDLAERRLPSAMIWPSYAVVISAFAAHSIASAQYVPLWRSMAGMAVLAAGYLALALLVGGLGAGDVKLAGLLGLALGWSSWTALLTGTFLGWLFAASARVALRTSGHLDRDAAMPLGPYLALGFVMAVTVSPLITP